MIEEAAQLNYQFKQKIRRSKIDQMFSKMRKELLDELQGVPVIHTNSYQVRQLVQQIKEHEGNLSLDVLKQINSFSVNPATCEILNQSEIIQKLMAYIEQEYLNTPQQCWSAYLLRNIFCLSSCRVPLPHTFLESLYVAAINSSEKTREYCTTILFQIIHDSDSNYLSTLNQDPSLSIINFMYQQMKSEPPSPVIEETLRCYYMLIKRLEYPKIESLIKLRPFLFAIIRSSNSYQLVFMATLCLNALMKCLPDERDLSKSGMLKIITFKALNMKSENYCSLVQTVTRRCAERSPDSEFYQVIFPFLFGILNKFESVSLAIRVYSMFSEILLNRKQFIRHILKNYPESMEQMLTVIETAVDKALVQEASYCISLFMWNTLPDMLPSFRVRVEQRFVRMIEQNQLNPAVLEVLQNLLIASGRIK